MLCYRLSHAFFVNVSLRSILFNKLTHRRRYGLLDQHLGVPIDIELLPFESTNFDARFLLFYDIFKGRS